MKIILIRHGESELNVMNKDSYQICSGQFDCNLTENGINQAIKLNGHDDLKDINKVYASDLKRAIKTANYIFDDINIEVSAFVIVSHFCTIRLILKHLLNLSNDKTLNLRIPNCLPIILTNENNNFDLVKPTLDDIVY